MALMPATLLVAGCDLFGTEDSVPENSADNQVASTQDIVPDDAAATDSPSIEEIVLPRCVYVLDPLNRYTIRTTYPRVVAGTGMTVTGYDVKAVPALTPSQQEENDPELKDAIANLDPVESDTQPLPQVDLELGFGYYEVYASVFVAPREDGFMSRSSEGQRVTCTTTDDNTVNIQ